MKKRHKQTRKDSGMETVGATVAPGDVETVEAPAGVDDVEVDAVDEEPARETVADKLARLRAPLRELRAVAEEKRGRLAEIAILLLTADPDEAAALRSERAELMADGASLPIQLRHLETVELEEIEKLLHRERGRVDVEVRDLCRKSREADRELRLLLNQLDEGRLVALQEPERSNERNRLNAEYKRRFPAYAELQKQIAALKVEACRIMLETEALARERRRASGLGWVKF